MRVIDIIVLTWNGKDLLRESLPALERALPHLVNSTNVLIVDNGSDDGTAEFVSSRFPKFQYVDLGKNFGFGEGNNKGVERSQADLVCFLNNDMIVEEDFLGPLLAPFGTHKDVFAVASQVFFFDPARPREETGRTDAQWDRGIVRFAHRPLTDVQTTNAVLPVFWAGGGAALFDRRKFLELGGFRSIYTPAYVEDADLSYRALKRGWKVLMAPKSHVVHRHRSTTKRLFNPEEVETLVARNRFFFIWSNLTDRRMLTEHLLSIPVRCFFPFWSAEARRFRRGLFQALPRWREARRLAAQDRSAGVLSDAPLLCRRQWARRDRKYDDPFHILFVCPYLPKLGVHAGAGRMFEVIRGMAARHEVSVLSFIESEQELNDAEELRRFCRSVRVVLRKGGHPVRDLFMLKPHDRLREFAHPEMKRLLVEEVGSGDYDLIQYEYLEMAYLKKSASGMGVPSLFTHHEVQHRSMLQEMRLRSDGIVDTIQRRIQWMKMLNFELTLAKQFDSIITMTEQDKRALTAYDPLLPVIVNETGVDVSYFASYHPVQEEEQSIVFLGYYRHKPNEDAVLYFVSQVLPLILQRYPGATMYVVGSDPTEEVRKLHDGKRVIVTGRLEDTRPVLARGSVFVVPVRLGAGIRGKILEAWSLRKAVVSTPLGCSGLSVRHEDNLLVAEDAPSFARAVERLFEDRPLRQRLGERGFETARAQYDWPLQIKKHLAIYENVISRDGI